MDVAFSRRATRQLASLRRYIAKQSGDERAQGYVDRIVSFCQNLSTSPQRGTDHGDTRKGMRSIGFERRVLVVFTIKDESVTVISVLYGGRNWQPR